MEGGADLRVATPVPATADPLGAASRHSPGLPGAGLLPDHLPLRLCDVLLGALRSKGRTRCVAPHPGLQRAAVPGGYRDIPAP